MLEIVRLCVTFPNVFSIISLLSKILAIIQFIKIMNDMYGEEMDIWDTLI